MTDVEKQRKIAQSRAERLEEREYTPEEEKYYAGLVKDWKIDVKKKD